VLSKDEHLAGIARQGFNVVCCGNAAPAYRALLAKHGLFPLVRAPFKGFFELETPKLAPLAAAPTREVFALGNADEPVPGAKLDAAERLYRSLRKAAPQKVVTTALNHNFPFGDSRFADVLLMDNYPIKGPQSDLAVLVTQAGMRDFGEQARARPWLVPGFVGQAFIWGGEEPTPAQVRAQTYLALVCGARAFFYYCYTDWPTIDKTIWVPGVAAKGTSKNPKRKRWFLRETLIWDAMPALFAELRALEDAVFAWDSSGLFELKRPSPLHATLRTTPAGLVLIAVNPQGRPNQAEVEFKDAAAAMRASPLFNTRPAICSTPACRRKGMPLRNGCRR